MRKCGTCFRYIESWRDAQEKGLKPYPAITFYEYHHKPRPGIKAHAIGLQCPDDNVIYLKHPACENHVYRWAWNLRVWWTWRFLANIKEFVRYHIRVPIGAMRKPVPLGWKDSFDGMADRIIPNGEPECPHCGEMPYNNEQCVFCGQRFLPDESHTDKTAPQREYRDGEPIIFMDGICPECGYSCGNGGYGPLRCRCGWVGEDREKSEKLRKAIDEAIDEEPPEGGCRDGG